MPDSLVQQVQSYLKAKQPLGMGYPFAANGEVDDLLISTLHYLQSALSSSSGQKISLISGSSINSNVIAEIERALNPKKVDAPTATPSEKKTTTLKDDSGIPSIEDAVSNTSTEEAIHAQNKEWESFLNQSLPVVGKLYDGDVASSAKKLEAAISKEINKPVAGMIWSDAKKQFNTTPDDILSALQKIEAHKKTPEKAANLSRDARYIKLADMLREYDLQKNAK